jgi:phage/plasmid-like protein (TIGR03299 family)
MSRESYQWLNTHVLVGHTAKRGNAWHYRQTEQQGDGNHFTGPVPLDRAVTLLDSPRLTEATAEASVLTASGVIHIADPTRKSVVRLPGSFGPDDPGAILGSHRAGYALHGYGQWLLRHSERILHHADGELEIGTCGLLKGGAVAWAQFEMPTNVTTASGATIAPFFAATTSCDGSIATGYMTGCQLIVCDNTLAAAEAQADRNSSRYRIRHTAQSLDRVTDVHEALDLLVKATDTYATQIDTLARQTVTPTQFETFLTRWAPKASDTKMAKTMADKKRGELRHLYCTDERVTPWTGTAFGVLQAVNTHVHHVKRVVGDTRYSRNQHDFLRGETAKTDQHAMTLLHSVLS